MRKNSKLQEPLRVVRCYQGISTVHTVVKRWYQQVMLIDIIGEMVVNIKYADKDIYVQTKL